MSFNYTKEETFLLKIDKETIWDREDNRLNQVGNKGTEIVGASTDSTRALIETTPANIIYVNFTTGNDTTGDGSSGNPYKTYSKAVSVWTSGKTIEWMDGTDLSDNPISKPLQSSIGTAPNWSAGGWSDKLPATQPNATAACSIARVGSDLFLFGGIGTGSVIYNETWKYDTILNTWTNMTPASPPSARYSTRMDSIGTDIFMFGGSIFSPSSFSNETWKYDTLLNTWTLLSPAISPSVRDECAYISDGTNIYMFGGKGSGLSSPDTWKFDGTNWTNLNPSVQPQLRYGSSFNYISNIPNKLYMFGGFKNGIGQTNETWEYDIVLNTWTQLNPSTSPSPRYYMGYASSNEEIVIFGGTNITNVLFDETWRFDGTNWSQSIFSIKPTNSYWLVMAYYNNSFYLYGGRDLSIYYNKTWELTENIEISDDSALCGFVINSGLKVLIGDLSNSTLNKILNCSSNSNTITIRNKLTIQNCEFTNGSIIPETIGAGISGIMNFEKNQFENFNIDFKPGAGTEIGRLEFYNNYIQSDSNDCLKYATSQTYIENNLIKADEPNSYAINFTGNIAPLNINNNTILGNVLLNNTTSGTGVEIRDNIFELNGIFQMLNSYEIESGNLRNGAVINATIAAIVSNIDPMFKSSSNFDLRRKSEGYASDSLLIGKSVYSTYTYMSQPYPRDLGCYNMNNETAITKYNSTKNFVRPDSISHEIQNQRKFNISISGKPDLINEPDSRVEVIDMTFKSLDAEYLTFIEQLESLTDLTVYLALDGESESPISFTANGLQSGTFTIIIQPQDVPTGSRFQWFGINYYIINRYPATGNATELQLSRRLLNDIPDTTVINTFEPIGLGEFIYLIPESETLSRVSSKKQYPKIGQKLTFIRQKP